MKTRQRKIFERVVNPLIIKHLTPTNYRQSCICSGIPIKYLSLTLKKYLLKKMQRKLDTDIEVSQV